MLVVTDRCATKHEWTAPKPGKPASASLTRSVKWDVEAFDVSEDGRTVVASCSTRTG